MPRATKPAPLRAVAPDERKTKARPKSLTAAAKDGSPLELLEFMRDRVATAVEDPNCPARELASLTRRLHEITRDIAALRAAAEDEDGAADTADEAFDASAI